MSSSDKPQRQKPVRKQVYATSSPYEQQFGYYRAVRHGQSIFVSGTTAIDPTSSPDAPQILYPNDARQQTRVALRECLAAVQALGGSRSGPENIVRVRMFVARHEDCRAVGEGFRDVLGKTSGIESGSGSGFGSGCGSGTGGRAGMAIGAAATMIVVQNGFVDERMLVEIEVDAILEEEEE